MTRRSEGARKKHLSGSSHCGAAGLWPLPGSSLLRAERVMAAGQRCSLACWGNNHKAFNYICVGKYTYHRFLKLFPPSQGGQKFPRTKMDIVKMAIW